MSDTSDTSEEAFRALLDARGVLRADAGLAPPERDATYAVFAQRTDARLDIDALRSQAAQFFATKLGVTVEKQYGALSPQVDAVRIVVAGADASACGTRLCYGRPVVWDDLAAANEAEQVMKTYGLALLAKRCGMIWLIASGSGGGSGDRVALTIAGILASVVLGPIVTPGRRQIFGVKGARLELEADAARRATR